MVIYVCNSGLNQYTASVTCSKCPSIGLCFHVNLILLEPDGEWSDRCTKCPACEKFPPLLSLVNHIRSEHKLAAIFRCTKCAEHFGLVEQYLFHQIHCTESKSQLPLTPPNLPPLIAALYFDILVSKHYFRKVALEVLKGNESLERLYCEFKAHLERPEVIVQGGEHCCLDQRAINMTTGHKLVQQMWHEDKRTLWNVILKDPETKPITLDAAYDYLNSIFTNPSPASFRPDAIEFPGSRDFMYYITLEDIENQLSHKKKVTRSIDTVTRIDLLRNISQVQILLNLCLLKENVPDSWKRSMTILIKKDINASCLADYKPINISMVIYRTLMGILSRRINQWSSKLPNQLNFSSSDATLETATCLRYFFTRTDSVMAQICMANLLERVNQQVVLLLLLAYGFKVSNAGFLYNVLVNTTTYISMDEQSSKDIKYRNALREGDPMSKVLKTLLIDQLLRRVEKAQCGVVIESEKQLTAIGQNDTLILFAPSNDSLERVLHIVLDFFRQIDLYIQELEVDVYKTTRPLCVYGQVIHPTFVLKFQGNDIISEVDTRMHIAALNSYIAKVDQPTLYACQKMYFLKAHILPKVIFQVGNENFTERLLRLIDRIVRQVVRRWHPNTLFNTHEVFYSKNPRIGFGLQELSVQVPSKHLKGLQSLLSSENWFIKEIITTDWFQVKLRHARMMNLAAEFSDY